MRCEKCSRETDENCKSCPEYEKLEKERENIVSLLLLKCQEDPKLYNKIGNIIYKDLEESNAYLNLVCTYVVLKLKEGAEHENN